ncbi:hypothetical protein HYV73_03315 [Candidatus Uhrbacteria bacterium]|nr:hypothetical protein [Candidatus Uhrbacteria bacterium]
MSSFFVLGSHPSISLAELIQTNPALSPITVRSKEIAVSESALETADARRLGGLIKTGTIIASTDGSNPALLEALHIHLKKHGSETRAKFGISDYRPGASSTEKMGLAIKSLLKEAGTPARFVSAKETTLSSVIVSTNKLLPPTGYDFCLFPNPDGGCDIGVTTYVQSFQSWSRRDFGRPRRDAKAGMLPPKLARMLVNLANGNPTKDVLIDPFCGSGTVLMEAALLGYAHLIGSDITASAVANSKANLLWLRKDGYAVPPILLMKTPAQELPGLMAKKADRIVAEVHLGAPKQGVETEKYLREEIKSLAVMYTQVLRQLGQIANKKAVAVLAFPIYRFGGTWLALPIKDIVEGSGWAIRPATAKWPDRFNPSLSPNGGLLYARKEQHVGRDIIVLEKV